MVWPPKSVDPLFILGVLLFLLMLSVMFLTHIEKAQIRASLSSHCLLARSVQCLDLVRNGGYQIP